MLFLDPLQLLPVSQTLGFCSLIHLKMFLDCPVTSCCKHGLQAGIIEEIVNDAVDTALDSDDIEEEIEDEVDKVLTEIAGETAAQLPEAAKKERLRIPAQRASTSHQVCIT